MAFSFKKRAKKEKKTDNKIRKERVPPKGKPFKPAKGSCFIIFVGDEGAILVHLKHNTVLSRQFVPDASESNLEEFTKTFAKDPKAPIQMIVDNMDQTYIQQTLPPVSIMSVGKLIKRRMDRDFSADDIKGSVLLGREKSGRKDWKFMMIALERSPQLSVWIDFILELPNRFSGIHLISVEAELMIKTLERIIGIPKEGTGSEWKFFVSHNKVGGFRQVILHNGRIIFTRLAQPLAEANPEVIAGNMEQEMLSTIEYMKRLSYGPQSGLDIYIVASSGIKEALDTQKFNATSTKVYTPYEISQLYGIEGATKESDQFGDVILAAIIGGSRKHVLTLTIPEYQKLDILYKATVAQRALLVATAMGLIGYSAYMGYDISRLDGEINKLERQRKTEQNTLTALRKQISRTKLDVEKATDLIDLYQQLKKENVTPLPFINKLKPLIAPPIGLKSIEWLLIDAKAMQEINPLAFNAAKAKNPAGKWMKASLLLELPAVAVDSKARRIIVNKILTDFRATLNGYTIIVDSGSDKEKENNQQYKLSSEFEAVTIKTDVDPTKLVEETLSIYGPLYPPAKKEPAKDVVPGAVP